MSDNLIYTAFVKYFDQENACEIDAGDELIVIKPDDDDDQAYLETIVEDLLIARGYDRNQFEIAEVIEGQYDNPDDFWDAVEENQEAENEHLRRQEEEMLWEEYLLGNYEMH